MCYGQSPCREGHGKKNPVLKRKMMILASLSIMCILGVSYQMKLLQEERLLEERWNSATAKFSTDCDVAIAMASDIRSTRGMYASINSIVTNYKDAERKLCFFIFSTERDMNARRQGMDCVFSTPLSMDGSESGSDNITTKTVLPPNVQIIHKQIRRDTWQPIIYSKAELEQEPNNLEYMYIRYNLKPADVEGMQRVIWIDSDTIVRGDVQELYDWDLQGRAVAGAKYWEPLKEYLCTNPRLDGIKMKQHFGRKTTPFRVENHLNTGLLVLDLYQIHRQRILDKWHDLVVSHELDCLWTPGSGDKAFDLALNGHYTELPNVWNVGYLGSQEYHRYNCSCNNAKMLHWNGIGKPYNEGRGISLCVDQFDIYDIVSLQNKGECMPSML